MKGQSFLMFSGSLSMDSSHLLAQKSERYGNVVKRDYWRNDDVDRSMDFWKDDWEENGDFETGSDEGGKYR